MGRFTKKNSIGSFKGALIGSLARDLMGCLNGNLLYKKCLYKK